MSSHHYRVWFEDDTLLVCKHCLAQGRCELVGDHGSKDSNVFAFAYPRQGNVCHAFRHCRVIEPDNEFFDVGTLCLADRHRVRQAKGIMQMPSSVVVVTGYVKVVFPFGNSRSSVLFWLLTMVASCPLTTSVRLSRFCITTTCICLKARNS